MYFTYNYVTRSRWSYYIGERNEEIIHCRLRVEKRNLNNICAEIICA